jgi:two-component system, LytTR family, sensor kinase
LGRQIVTVYRYSTPYKCCIDDCFRYFPIIVQTLVENAIKHGLKDSANGVSIKIQSQLEKDFLKIDIINSGQLRHSTPSVISLKNSGIGVDNTRRRLEMIYGESARFELQNLNETEVIAALQLPI